MVARICESGRPRTPAPVTAPRRGRRRGGRGVARRLDVLRTIRPPGPLPWIELQVDARLRRDLPRQRRGLDAARLADAGSAPAARAAPAATGSGRARPRRRAADATAAGAGRRLASPARRRGAVARSPAAAAGGRRVPAARLGAAARRAEAAGRPRAPARRRRAPATSVEMSSPGSAMTAISAPTGTVSPAGDEDLAEHAGAERLHLDVGLVGLDLGQDVAALDRGRLPS